MTLRRTRDFIAGESLEVTVNAVKTGYTPPETLARTLTVDLVTPAAPVYTAPQALTVGEAIAAMSPAVPGDSDIVTYSVVGLPSGLNMDAATGTISGTPDAATTSITDVTVTAADAAGNTVETTIVFPPVSSDTRAVLIDSTTLAVPEGEEESYSVRLTSRPSDTVTVTPVVEGNADIVLNPDSLDFTTENWAAPQTVTISVQEDVDGDNEAATVSHEISGGDYAEVSVDDVAVIVIDDETASTAISLAVDPAALAETADTTAITVTATLDAAPRGADTLVEISVGAAGDSASEGVDYLPVADFALTIEAGAAAGSAEFPFAPIADAVDEEAETVSLSGAAGDPDLTVAGAALTIENFPNSAPVFPDALPDTLEVAENTTAGTTFGAPFAATDAEGHTLDYSLTGPEAENFSIDSQSGQLSTLAALDHEMRNSYSLHLTADDGFGGTSRLAVKVKVTDVDERPGKPDAPIVLAASGGTTGLSLRWSAPDTEGGPAITGYELQYRVGTDGDWRGHRHLGTATRATIAGVDRGHRVPGARARAERRISRRVVGARFRRHGQGRTTTRPSSAQACR